MCFILADFAQSLSKDSNGYGICLSSVNIKKPVFLNFSQDVVFISDIKNYYARKLVY